MNKSYQIPQPVKIGNNFENGKILIVGGYGQVGYGVAQRLAPIFPNRLIIAGRNLDKAKAAASEIGSGTNAQQIDIYAKDNERALNGVKLVLVCLDQANTGFVKQCLSRSIHYVDISADYNFLLQIERLDNLAKEHNASAILSVGVAPGLTNLLAAHIKEKMEIIERLDIFIKLGLGDNHGAVSIDWMLDNLDKEYEVSENNMAKQVRSFGESTKIILPDKPQSCTAWRFAFSDQNVIARTLNIPTVSTWLSFDSQFISWAFAKLSQLGIGSLLRRNWWRKAVRSLIMNVNMGSDICSLAARAQGKTKRGKNEITIGIVGRKQALMTAIVTTQTIKQILTSNPKAGVFHSEQIIALDPIIKALKDELPNLEYKEL